MKINFFEKMGGIVITTILLLFFNHGYCQVDTTFSAIILFPQTDGYEVGNIVRVNGTATNPRGRYLWVLCHRADLRGKWWPQNWSSIDPKTKKWSVTVSVGERRDIGEDFEIAVISVAEDQHHQLENYVLNLGPSNGWPAQRMPDSPFAPIIRVVKKISHE